MNNVEQHDAVCKELNQLYKQKNQDYGDSFHETFLEEGMAMARIRLTDKLNRFKKLTRHDSVRNVADESVRDTLIDLANYAIMTVMELDREVPFMSKTDAYEPWADKVRGEWDRVLVGGNPPRAVTKSKTGPHTKRVEVTCMSKTDTPMSKTDSDDAECDQLHDWLKDNANDVD